MDKFLNDIWGTDRLFLDMDSVVVADEYILAPIMATNARNYDRFIALSEFRDILHELNLKANIHSVQSTQVGIINAIKGSKISVLRLINALNILKDESIISQDELVNLINFLNLIPKLSVASENNSLNLKERFFGELNALDAICDKIGTICDDENIKLRLNKAKLKHSELKFNIVVTGVINSGKSTLLNALLGARILGTSNVPETINLTLLKYAKTPYARVNFWNEAELNELSISLSDEFKSLAGKNLDIKIDELKGYTTAQNEISRAVKSVELYENLELLKDGVCVIDTPGIDDAVFLREELVKRYMNECDLIIHLMNASQSATQKDLDFLINSLKNSHVARLIIAVTHVDLLGVDELNEVINYTLKSVKERLISSNLEKIANEMKLFN